MPVIYIGPNKLKLGLKRYTLYTERPGQLIEKLKGSYPLIENLFVPVDHLGMAEDEAKKKGYPRYMAVKQIGDDE